MITRLGHATIYVLDQQAAHDFYVNILGFTIHTDVTMDGGFRWLTICAPKQPDLEIILMKVQGGEHSPMSEGVAERLKWIMENGKFGVGVFECDDCQKTFEDLSAKGVKFVKEPTKEFYGTEAVFEDPFGNWFSLTEMSPRQM